MDEIYFYIARAYLHTIETLVSFQTNYNKTKNLAIANLLSLSLAENTIKQVIEKA